MCADTVQARVGAERRAATRERILDATRRMLERGDSVAEITVARLADEAEVSRATFYLHFPDKRHLVEALFASARAGWRDIAADALSDPAITKDQLREVLAGGVQNGLRYRAIVAGIVELGESDAEIRAGWQQHMRTSDTQLAWLAACRPDLSERQVQLLTHVLNWMAERTIQRMLGVRDEPWCEPAELADAFTEIWWSVAHPAPPTTALE